jgi:hypothetical protein
MRRVSSIGRFFAILLVGLTVPVTLVHAQTPSASPTAEANCTPEDVDPTKLDDGNSISFERLAGPPAGATEGPSLWRVNLGDNSWYFGGCILEPVAIYVSSGPVYLKSFSGTTHIFYAGNSLPSSDCTATDEKPEHETRNVCVLASNGKPATLQTGDAAFHDGEATYEYATNEDLLGLNAESGLANALSARQMAPRSNAAAAYQPGGDPSIDVASGHVKPYGCGGDCL